MGHILPYNSIMPKLGENVFVAPTATVAGDVTIGDDSSIWFGAVVRGDFQPVIIGKGTNVQDNAIVHVMGDKPTIIGDGVTIGHGAIIHCGRIGNNCLVGMGSIVLGYTDIRDNVIIGAASLITQHKKIPANSLVFGNPAKIIRGLRDDEIEALRESADVIADATHLNPRSRAKLLSHLNIDKTHTQVVTVVMRTPLNVCIERNENRRGTRGYVSPSAIKRMYNSFKMPTTEEYYSIIDYILVIP